MRAYHNPLGTHRSTVYRPVASATTHILVKKDPVVRRSGNYWGCDVHVKLSLYFFDTGVDVSTHLHLSRVESA